MIWVAPLIALVIFEAIADIFAKKYSLVGSYQLWLTSIGFYIIANSFWLYSLKSGAGLTRGAIIFSVASAVLATIIGLYFYNEKLSNLQLAGVFIGIVSLILIFWE